MTNHIAPLNLYCIDITLYYWRGSSDDVCNKVIHCLRVLAFKCFINWNHGHATAVECDFAPGECLHFSCILRLLLIPRAIKDNSKYGNISSITSVPSGSCTPTNVWSTAVHNPYIYEKFMNHLETEFSVENLLFITEFYYVQMKNILKQKYSQLDEMIKDNNRSIKFDVKLAILNDLRDDKIKLNAYDDINGEKKQSQVDSIEPAVPAVPPVVPVSLIAKRLQLSNNSNSIILAFRLLYNKYIDDNGAPFMIHISSLCRQELMISLDCKYYQRMKRRKKTNQTGSTHEQSFIDHEWAQHENSMEWLLVELLTKMDSAAREISSLMQQSFVRFKK